MLNRCQLQYSRLLQQLADLSGTTEDPLATTEKMFRLCLAEWHALRTSVEHYTFKDRTEEIHFFRELKPKFTALIELCVLRYRNLLFTTGNDPASCQQYRFLERKAAAGFFKQHRNFFREVRSGNPHFDQQYFTRLPSETALELRPYPDSAATASAGDRIMAKLYAWGEFRGGRIEK